MYLQIIFDILMDWLKSWNGSLLPDVPQSWDYEFVNKYL